MSQSPLQDAEGPLRVRLLGDGADVSEAVSLVSATVRRSMNEAPAARFVFADGDMPTQTFPASDAATFALGAKITFEAGYGDRTVCIFAGKVVRHSLTISAANEVRLVIGCRGEAQADVSESAPSVDARPALSVTYGDDLLAFQADLDSLPPDDASDTPPQQPGSGRPRLRGHMRFAGSALAKVGGLVELKGVGRRFNGNVLVAALTHRIGEGAWTTELEFGTPPLPGEAHAGRRAPPSALTATNEPATARYPTTRFEFNGVDKTLAVTTTGNNRIVLSDKDKSIVLTDPNNNQVELDANGITLDSPKNIRISAKGTISVEALGALSMSSKADVKVEGLNLHCSAQVGLVARGASSAELSAAGQTTVKGAVVMIN